MIGKDQNHSSVMTGIFYTTLYKEGEDKGLSLTYVKHN